MEKTLPEDLKMLQNVIETAPFPIGVYKGEELEIVLANSAMIQTFGKGDNVVGKLYTELLPELQTQNIFEQARSVIKTGIPFHAKNNRVDIVIDGVLKPHYFNYSFTPLKDTDGNTYAVMNTGADVTDLNMAQQQAEIAKEKLRLAVASAELGVYEVDLHTNKITASDNFHKIWGTNDSVTREEIMQKIHEDDRIIRNEAHEKASKSGNLCYIARITPRDNQQRWIRVKGKFSFDQWEKPITILGIIQDITEQRQFAEELQKQVAERTAELSSSNENLLQFANMVSHDLKEPVRKINIFNNLLKNELAGSLDEKNTVYFDKVQHSTQRMTSIIEGVLKYSTLNKSGYPIETLDLNIIIDDIKTDLELIIQEKKAILIKDELPQIEGAPILIHQLFYNLMHNALKFSRPDNPPRVTISCSILELDGVESAWLIIKDNGIGFDPAYAQKIFNAFERLHSKDQYEGTGLGLSLCKKIVERHHGKIEAIGGHNEGAEFIISLPLKQKDKKI